MNFRAAHGAHRLFLCGCRFQPRGHRVEKLGPEGLRQGCVFADTAGFCGLIQVVRPGNYFDRGSPVAAALKGRDHFFAIYLGRHLHIHG
jgi:hypothetical protein